MAAWVALPVARSRGYPSASWVRSRPQFHLRLLSSRKRRRPASRSAASCSPPSCYVKLNPSIRNWPKKARIQGVVKLHALISKDGTIEDLTVLCGHPLLVPSAMEAVKQWVYQPTLLNGETVG
jgi:outer membrane biosynthesis protein TonB